jgi:enterobacterial common antigen flippase
MSLGRFNTGIGLEDRSFGRWGWGRSCGLMGVAPERDCLSILSCVLLLHALWEVAVASSIAAKVRWIFEAKDGTSAVIQTFLSRILILGVNLFTGMVTARLLGPEGRGAMTVIALWPGFIAYCCTLGMPSATIYCLRNYPEMAGELFSAAMVITTCLGAMAGGIGAIGIPHWISAEKYSADAIFWAQVFMATAPFSLLALVSGAALEAVGNFSAANRQKFMVPLSTLGILVSLHLTGHLTPPAAAFAYVISSLTCLLTAALDLKLAFGWVWPRSMVPFRRLLHHGTRIYGIDLLNTLSGQLGQVLVAGLLSPINLGYYNLTMNLSRNLGTIQGSLVSVLFPKLVGRPIEEIQKLTEFAAKVSFYALTLISLPVIGLASLLLTGLYGQDFHAATMIFQLLVVESILSCLVWLLTQVFIAMGQSLLITLLQAGSLVVTVALMFFLAPSMGLVGAGLALLCSTVLRLVLSMACFPWVLKISPPNLIWRRQDWRQLQQRLSRSRQPI